MTSATATKNGAARRHRTRAGWRTPATAGGPQGISEHGMKPTAQTQTPPRRAAFNVCSFRDEKISRSMFQTAWTALGRPGSDLLSHVLRRSIIGAEEFNGRVRNGIGFWAPRKNHQAGEAQPYEADAANSRRRRPNHTKHVWSFALSRRTRIMRVIKPIELLVPVSFMRCRTSTPGLSTWWSSTALKGELVLRWVSRLDAFSGYPVRT